MPHRSIDVPGASHNAPIPAGARVGPLLCSSGISGKDPVTGQLPADPAAQVKAAFANLQALLTAGGAKLSDVVEVCDDAARHRILRTLEEGPQPIADLGFFTVEGSQVEAAQRLGLPRKQPP